MSDNYPVESGDLSARGTRGVMSAGAGLGLMGFNMLLGIPVLGWIISGGLVLLGASGIFGKTKTDKVSGTIALVAGGAGVASLLLPGMTHFLLGAGGLGLLAYGGYNIFKFASGIRKRAR